jgi:Flp pilus assembly protein TadD
VDHPAGHGDGVAEDFIRDPKLFERVNSASGEGEINRAAANDVPFARIGAALVKRDLVAAAPEISSEQTAGEAATNQNELRHGGRFGESGKQQSRKRNFWSGDKSYLQGTISDVALGIRSIALLLLLWEFCATPQTNAAATNPDQDPQLSKLLEDARNLIDAKKPQLAIEKCDKVIEAFKTHYAKSEHKIYCARSSSENLAYLVMAGANMNNGHFEKGKKDAIALSSTWSSAYYMKGWALEELNKMREARTTILQAIELSPFNSHYLNELAYLFMLEKNWPKALETYRAAEEHAALSPDDVKQAELGRARRGMGYVLVELGKLDEAEEKYLECLKDDPNDKKAAAELEYVRNLKAKTRG